LSLNAFDPNSHRSSGLAPSGFDPLAFLTGTGLGRAVVHVEANKTFFAQGDTADAIFYLQIGDAKLTVTSEMGKEATITLMHPGDFIGEECLTALPGPRTATAFAVTPCTLTRIDKFEMIRVLHDEVTFSEVFLGFLLSRIVSSQAHVVDLLFNSSEKRLAGILLVMAEHGEEHEDGVLIPKITQEALADMVGTTRSRISLFMNRFRDLGYINYDGRIRVQKALIRFAHS
jgi:CRP/FNR family cyclic AMP-dependent transcriptional regulator